MKDKDWANEVELDSYESAKLYYSSRM